MPVNGERIRQRRKALGLTQDELAAQIGVDQKQISNYENSKDNPTSKTLAALADALGTSSDYLLDRTDDPTPPLSHGNIGDLSWKERRVIDAWRRGNIAEAMKILVNG